MMPNINRLTGRFFTVLISLGVAVLLPRAAVAGDATPQSPLASPARTELALGVRAELPSTRPFAALYKDAAAGLNSEGPSFPAWPTERRFTPFRLEHPAPVLVASAASLPSFTSPAKMLAGPPMGGTKLPSPTLCQISDTVYRADGSPAQGTVLLSWQAFTTAAGQSVTPGSLLVTLDAGGGFNASLAPNTGASPAGTYYKALFKLNDGTTETELWVVPNTQTTTIGAIRSKLVPSNQAAQFLTRDYADSNYVGLASAQTITGVKTFSGSPAVPTPQNPSDAANKAYVDANAGSGNLASPPPIGNTTPNTVAATTQTATDSRTSLFPYVDVRAYGAVGDAVHLGGCSITAGQVQLTCNGPFGKGFTAASVGKLIDVPQAGATVPNTDNSLITTIATYVDANHVTLAASAVATVSSGTATFGTDNATAFCAATQCTQAMYMGIFANGILSGRELYIPGGAYLTTQPLYCRENLTCRGAGQGGTQIILASLQNPLPAPATVNFNTANITPTICLGNATAGTGTCSADLYTNGASGSLTVYDVVVSNVGSQTVGIFGSATVSNFIDRVWTQNYYGVVGYLTLDTSIHELECDTSVVCIAAIGDGSSTPARSYGWQITDSQLGNRQVGIWLNGMQDVIISNNNSQDYQYPIWIYSPSGHSSYRILINGNDLGSTNNFSTQNLIEIAGPCIDCSITNNHFSYSGNSDIVLETAAAGTTNLVVSKNHFSGSQWSSFSANGITSGSWIGEGNVWDTPGQYAVFSGNMNVKFDNNTCVNPFSVHPPQAGGANPYENGCFFFTGSTASTVEASNNSVTSSGSTKYPAVNLYGPSIAISGSTSGNRSDYSGCAVCAFSSSTGLVTSFNELATNYGTSAAGLFSPLVAQQVNVIGDLTARDISGVEYFVSHYASIQAAINAAYNNGAVLGTVIDDRTSPYTGAGFILYDSVTLKLAATTYTITSTVTYNNGNNNVTAGIIAIPGARLIGASTSSNHGTIITAGNGLNADLIATSTVGTGIGAAAQWWHWGGFENLRVTGNGANQTAGNCFNIENMGETSFLRTIEVSGCYLDNILFTGASATPSDIANITTNRAGRYGFNFNNLSGVAVVHGLSGDSNVTSLVRLNGGQSGTLTILGFKTEEEISGQDPLITIDQTGQNGAQPGLFIVGGYTFGRSGVNDIIKYVNGTAGTAPYISVSNFYTQNYVNAVNDTVNGRTTAAANMNKVPFYYGPTGAFYSGQAYTLDLNTFVQSPHSGNGILTEIFGTTSSNETLVAASGTSTDPSVGGIGFRMPNRTTYGQSPELFAKMTYAFPGGVPNTQQWEFIPAKVGGDTSTRWIGDPSYRWDEIYSADVNSTTATIGTLNVTTCNGCGSSLQQVNSDWNASSGVAQVLNKPSIPAPQVNSDWNASSGVAQILNKPALATVATSGSYNDLSNKPAIPVQGAHLVSGTMQGNTATLTGNSADQTIYTATLPAGTFTVGTGAHCWAKWQHSTSGSTAITYKWILGSTTVAYGSFTSASVNAISDVEVLTPASLTAQIINASSVIAGTTIQAGPSNGNAGSENLANSDTLKLTFNAGSGEQVKGMSFYCQTIQ